MRPGMRRAIPQGRTATFAPYVAGNRVDGLWVLHRGIDMRGRA